MDLSIIVVNYKSVVKTLSCVQSVLAANLENISYEVIVVDNNSRDGLEKTIKDKFPQVIFISSSTNLGMGGGNNLGIKASASNFSLVLNPDTLVDRETIQVLYKYIIKNETVGIVGPKLLNPDKSLQYSCAHFPTFFTPILRRTFLGWFAKDHIDWFLMKRVEHDTIKEVDWLMGSCLMIRKSDWALFDKRFFMYFEDIDLCRRSWHNDYSVVYNPEATIIHDHQRDSAKQVWFVAPFFKRVAREHIKSWLKYFWKWKYLNNKKIK